MGWAGVIHCPAQQTGGMQIKMFFRQIRIFTSLATDSRISLPVSEAILDAFAAGE